MSQNISRNNQIINIKKIYTFQPGEKMGNYTRNFFLETVSESRLMYYKFLVGLFALFSTINTFALPDGRPPHLRPRWVAGVDSSGAPGLIRNFVPGKMYYLECYENVPDFGNICISLAYIKPEQADDNHNSNGTLTYRFVFKKDFDQAREMLNKMNNKELLRSLPFKVLPERLAPIWDYSLQQVINKIANVREPITIYYEVTDINGMFLPFYR